MADLTKEQKLSGLTGVTDIVDLLSKVNLVQYKTGWTSKHLAADAIREITRLRQLLSEAEKSKKEAKTEWAFAEGDLVRKKSGSWWEGRVVGTYTTEQTPRGYAVQLDKPFGPVQIYPESALESAPQSEER